MNDMFYRCYFFSLELHLRHLGFEILKTLIGGSFQNSAKAIAKHSK